MPKVSITIPCRNEENYIVKCLQSIVDSDYPKDKLEVFVCDGLSTDKTIVQVLKFEEKYPFIELLLNKKQTTPHALNIGLKESDADYNIILGAHAEIEKDFIQQNINTFEQINDNQLACVGGFIENIFEDEDSKIIGYAMSSSFGVGNAHFRTGGKDGFVDTVAFGMYKAEVFDDIGYFDESLARNQDDEFNYRLLKNGYKIYLSEAIKSKYYVRASFLKLFRQYFQYGYWKVIVNKKHNKITTLRQLAPFMFVLFLIVGFISSLFSMVYALIFLTILSIYFFLAILSTLKFKISITNKLKLIKAFLILHISYGLGYLMAIKDLIFLRKFVTNKKMEITR
ncbi:MAG: glycosyltransferase family 2 protein [Bacteroidales bacterium]|nr:glycosyltransferase family 2 protein [Bacteroidales bacterium]